MTSRRLFFGALAGLAALTTAATPQHRRYGYMDVKRWQSEGHVGKRVLCNGVDITDRCYAFDDRAGIAECFAGPEAHSDKYIDDVAREILRGRVEVIG